MRGRLRAAEELLDAPDLAGGPAHHRESRSRSVADDEPHRALPTLLDQPSSTTRDGLSDCRGVLLRLPFPFARRQRLEAAPAVAWSSLDVSARAIDRSHPSGCVGNGPEAAASPPLLARAFASLSFASPHGSGTSPPATTPFGAGVPLFGGAGSGGATRSGSSESAPRRGPRIRSSALCRSSSTSSASRP